MRRLRKKGLTKLLYYLRKFPSIPSESGAVRTDGGPGVDLEGGLVRGRGEVSARKREKRKKTITTKSMARTQYQKGSKCKERMPSKGAQQKKTRSTSIRRSQRPKKNVAVRNRGNSKSLYIPKKGHRLPRREILRKGETCVMIGTETLMNLGERKQVFRESQVEESCQKTSRTVRKPRD